MEPKKVLSEAETRALQNTLCPNFYSGTYVTNANRNARPVTNASEQSKVTTKECPFCAMYDTYPECDKDKPSVIKNGFPSHILENGYESPPADFLADPFHKLPAYGVNEVVLYPGGRNDCKYKLGIPEIANVFAAMPVEYLLSILEILINRFKALMENTLVSYIAIFENSGAAAGSTVSHPHCQTYVLPIIPAKIALELASANTYYEKYQTNLFVTERKHEIEKGVLYQNDSFIIFLPPYAEFPYAVKMLPKRFFNTIAELTNQEKLDLADAIKTTVTAYDHLFKFDKQTTAVPYMLGIKSAPINPIAENYCFNVEIVTPLRSNTHQVKLNASMETIFNHHVNPVLTSDAVENLAEAFAKAK